MLKQRKSRIVRGKPPSILGKKKILTDNNYRTASKKCLDRDFGRRCAYTMITEQHAGGSIGLEVDHFDPTLKGRKRHKYKNLFRALRFCNRRKADSWPTREEQSQGIRFLNPCEEWDYDLQDELEEGQIFMDPDTCEVWSLTPAARYHIEMLGLNEDFILEERRQARDLQEIMQASEYRLAKNDVSVNEIDYIKKMIGSLKSHRSMLPPCITAKRQNA